MLAAAACATFLYAGESPAAVEEQRRRLPPPATCKDPVEGLWMGLKYVAPLYQWYNYTLEIHRDKEDPNKLTGEVLAKFWDGTSQQEKPPACKPALMFVTVAQPAKGKYKDGLVDFGGTSWSLKENHCPPGRYVRYNTDHFSGKIDPTIQEFQSVNNDGGVAVNDPIVLRRIKCFDETADEDKSQPKIEIAPPPLQPPTKAARGCFGKP